MHTARPTTRAPLQVGERMPAFALPDAAGNVIRSDMLLGQGPLIVYFYPKDDTLGCTVEACGFRDRFAELRALGVTIVGISQDDGARHQRFAAKHRLPFPLLSDVDGSAARAFGVARALGLWRGRETFVMDQHGIVHGRFRSLIFPQRHVEYAVELARRLAEERAPAGSSV